MARAERPRAVRATAGPTVLHRRAGLAPAAAPGLPRMQGVPPGRGAAARETAGKVLCGAIRPGCRSVLALAAVRAGLLVRAVQPGAAPVAKAVVPAARIARAVQPPVVRAAAVARAVQPPVVRAAAVARAVQPPVVPAAKAPVRTVPLAGVVRSKVVPRGTAGPVTGEAVARAWQEAARAVGRAVAPRDGRSRAPVRGPVRSTVSAGRPGSGRGRAVASPPASTAVLDPPQGASARLAARARLGSATSVRGSHGTTTRSSHRTSPLASSTPVHARS